MRQKRRDVIDLKWLSARAFTQKWYPQGVDVGTFRGRRTLAVSWFRKEKSGQHLASRVTLIDLERSRHLDVSLAIEDEEGELLPAQIHAGGLAWFDERIYAAATGQGIWEFDLRDVRRVRGRTARRMVGARGRGYGAVALVAVRARVHPVPLRCSYIGRVFDSEGRSLPRVLIGEYRGDDRGRVGAFTIPADRDGSFAKQDEIQPGIRRMQGAVGWGDLRFVSQSRGDREAGVLWSGSGDALKRIRIALPVGCEDLALDTEGRMLWSLGEHPWRRVVRGIPFAQLDL